MTDQDNMLAHENRLHTVNGSQGIELSKHDLSEKQLISIAESNP